jgi:hypothetical protein
VVPCGPGGGDGVVFDIDIGNGQQCVPYHAIGCQGSVEALEEDGWGI